MNGVRIGRLWARLAVVLCAAALAGCGVLREFEPAVVVKEIAPKAYIAQQRGDILTTGALSAQTLQTIRVTGLDQHACATLTAPACLSAVAGSVGISDERRLSALAELWLSRAMSAQPTGFEAWMEAARYAYGYLFYTGRSPGERAFEERQTQVRDWYNYAVQQATTQLFDAARHMRRDPAGGRRQTLLFEGWTLHVDMHVRLPERAGLPQELVPASSLSFQGLRSTYQRDGFGSEFVAVTQTGLPVIGDDPDHAANPTSPSGDRRSRARAWSEMPSPNITVVFFFEGDTLQDVLHTHEVTVGVYDPLVEEALTIRGQRVPLAGNFTAGYGLWLARSGFNRQSLSSLFGRADGIERPHLYMMQPFDPNRRIIVMLHGLASSPEAWVNVANEILGDEALRKEFQVWQIYYPTNMPVALNHAAIRRLLSETLVHFDPQGDYPASHDLVVLGHSMGGMIARLMVSSADQQLWDWVSTDPRLASVPLEQWRTRLDPLLRFEPMPEVERAIFIAAPHQGTSVAGRGLVRWLASFIRLPLTLLQNREGGLLPSARAKEPAPQRILDAIPTSLDNLDAQDRFVQAAASLPIAPPVRYHSIIARAQADGPLEDSDDGFVPYRSAHLDGAQSEKVIVSGHSVQETAAAILEIRRILHQDIAERQAQDGAPQGLSLRW